MSTREPFSAEEQALAWRLREDAVPGPSPELDARILAQARAAVASAPSRRRRRPFLVGLASAAVLVLSVGVVFQLGQVSRDDLGQEPPAQAQMRAAPSPPADEAASAPMAMESAAPMQEKAADARLDVPAAPALELAPAPMESAPVRDQAAPGAVARQQRVSPQVFAEPPPSLPPPPPPVAAMAPPAPPAPSAPAIAPQSDSQAMQGLSTARQRHEAAADADHERSFERIRRLIGQGQEQRAHEALLRLRREHPELVLPEDLARFQREYAARQ